MTSNPATLQHAAAQPLLRQASGALTLRFAWLLIALVVSGLAYYHWHYEGWRETIVFASAVTATMAAVLTLLTRRLLFAVGVVAAIVAMIVVAADIKRRFIEMVLHAYDIVFYLTSTATLRFLWVDHKLYLLAIAGSMAATSTRPSSAS